MSAKIPPPELEAPVFAPAPVSTRHPFARALEGARAWFGGAGGRTQRQDIDAVAFVALVCCVQAYLLLSFVGEVGSNCPYYDEWEMIPALVGAQPITLDWLWSQHNEHRIVLPRLLYLLVVRLAGYDFRAGGYFNAGLLIMIAAACCGVARRLRGSTSYSDAFFPLLLLHCGQAQNLDWSFQIAFAGSAVITLASLLLLVTPGPLSYGAALAIGACTLALPLMGGQGLALVPALGCCTLLAALDRRRALPQRPHEWRSVLALAISGFALLAYYFVDYERPAKHPISPSFDATWKGAQLVLGTSLGTGATRAWKAGGDTFVLALLAVTALMILGILLRGARAERLRALRIGLFLGGMSCLVIGIGWARAAVLHGKLFESNDTSL